MSDLQISVEGAVAGIENSSTEDIGNGRRRARLSRRLKHMQLSNLKISKRLIKMEDQSTH